MRDPEAVASTGQLAEEVPDAVPDKHRRERQREIRLVERSCHAAADPRHIHAA
jgi:hypothetical protein